MRKNGKMRAAYTPLEYGVNPLWATPVRLGNLLKERVVSPKLHEWLERFAADPALTSAPPTNYFNHKKGSSRYRLSVFDSPGYPELRRIKRILIDRVDAYVKELFVNPIPQHDKFALFWFVIQHPNSFDDTVRPHYHSAGEVAVVYYLSAPADGSGTIVLFDPRGTIERGFDALPRHENVIGYAPRRGDILLFPRYVMHYTTVNTDVHDRKVIAGVVGYDRHDREQYRYPPSARRR